MAQKSLEPVFQEINDYYVRLLELSSYDNVEVEIKRIREELIIYA